MENQKLIKQVAEKAQRWLTPLMMPKLRRK